MSNGELGVIKYNVTDSAIAELKTKYTGLKIIDTPSYDVVRRAIGEVREKRVGVEERRKELKESALKYGRAVDAEAKRITGLLLEIETPLKSEKDRVDSEKARIKEEKEAKERARVDAIRAKIFDLQKIVANLNGKTAKELHEISENLFDLEIKAEVYQEFAVDAEKVRMECLNAALNAREARVKWDQEEAARKAEAERLAKEREAQEAERRKLEEERVKLEAEKRAQGEILLRQQIEANAKAQAERELKERLEHEERERERKAALAPDREKLLHLAHELEITIQVPIVTSTEAQTILDDAYRAIRGVVAMIRKEAEKL